MGFSKPQLISLGTLVLFFFMILMSLALSGHYYDENLNKDSVKNNDNVKEYRQSLEAVIAFDVFIFINSLILFVFIFKANQKIATILLVVCMVFLFCRYPIIC